MDIRVPTCLFDKLYTNYNEDNSYSIIVMILMKMIIMKLLIPVIPKITMLITLSIIMMIT